MGKKSHKKRSQQPGAATVSVNGKVEESNASVSPPLKPVEPPAPAQVDSGFPPLLPLPASAINGASVKENGLNNGIPAQVKQNGIHGSQVASGEAANGVHGESSDASTALIDEMMKKIQEQDARISDLEKKLEGAQKEIMVVTEAKEAAEKKVLEVSQSSEAAIEQLSSEKASLEGDVAALKKDLERLGELELKISGLKSLIAEKDAKLAEAVSTSNAVQILSAQKAELEGKIRKLEADLHVKHQSLLTHKESQVLESESSRKALELLSQQKAALESDLQSLREKLQEKKNADLHKSKLEWSIRDKDAMLAENASEKKAMAEKLQTAQATIVTLEEQAARATEAKEAKEAELQAALRDNGQLRNEVVSLKSGVDALTQRVRTMEEEKESSSNTLSELKAQVRAMETRLVQQGAELEVQRLSNLDSSLMNSSIPVGIVGVVLGASLSFFGRRLL